MALSPSGWLADVGLAAALVVVSAVEHVSLGSAPTSPADPGWVDDLLVVLTPAFIVVRRVLPSVALLGVTILLVAQILTIETTGNAVALTVLLATYSAAAFERRPLAYVTVSLGVVILVGGAAVDGTPLGTLASITVLYAAPPH